MNKIFVFLVALICQYTCVANDPEGWSALKQKIQSTPISNVSSLLDQTFDLVVTGATEDYEFKVTPGSAFKVQRLTNDKFRITIINPSALINDDVLVTYHPIGWQLNKLDRFGLQIEGIASCLYNIKFSQTGVGEIDLSKFDETYDITYELSNPAVISTVTRDGPGYAIIRTGNSSDNAEMRLRIKKISGTFDIQTDWIAIPSCRTQITTTPPPTITESEDAPSPMPTTVTVIPPNEYLDINMQVVSFCDDAYGNFCTTLTVTAKNISDKRLRCNKVFFQLEFNNQIYGRHFHWIDLNAGQVHTFTVNIVSPVKPSGNFTYNYYKTECSYP